MAVTMKTKSSPRRRAPSHRTVMLTKGDWLDVMDQEGVWNVARVLSVPSPEEVEVMYDGWPEEYDEVVRVDSDRVAPFHTFTWAVKCWVKYLNWPMWPSVITIRTPGTKAGIENLSREKQLYVDFLDDPNFDKRDRCWQKKKQVKEFRTHYEASRGMSNGPDFENALEWALLSNATTVMPTFSRGTLPLQYNESTTESVKKMRKNMGNDLWYQSFENNCKRHSKTHVYTIPEDVGSEDSSGILSQMNRLEVRRPITSKPEKQSSPRKKKSRSKTLRDNTAVEIEQDLPEEIEVPLVIEQDVSKDIGVPYEPESSESSDDQGEISDEDFNDQSNTTTERSVLLSKRAAHQSKPLMKMAARRSVPPITGYLDLTASPKPKSTRSPPLAYDTDDSEEEEKGTEKVRVGKQNELGPKVTASGRAPNGLTQASGAAELQTSRRRASAREQEDPPEDPLEGLLEDMLEDMRGDTLEDTSGDTLEERIAYTQSVLRNLEAKRQESVNARVLKERRKRVKPSPPSAHDISASRSNKNQSSFLQAPEKRMSADSRRQGTIKTPLEVGEELKHSFLSIEDAYSSDSQERKRVPAPKDDDVANDEEMLMLDAQSEPKETNRSTRAKSPRLTERKGSADFKQLDDEMSDDQARIDAKCQEVRRPFCVMQAGLEVVLADSSEIDGEQKAQAKPSRKTVIAVPRKFNESVQKAFMSEPPLSPRTAVFNSSEGFSMGKWFKRSIRPKHRSTKHFKMTQ